ncbi:MAG: hypothetical protein NT027_06075, partial [Proteobacteria bacterium]|nr:hypothetical protein [Pseudomonadota bacterium]
DSGKIADLHMALNNVYGSHWSTILLENVEGLTSIKSLLEYFKSLKILVILTSSVHPLAWMPRNGFQSDSWLNENSFIELVPLNYISWANQNSDILDKMGEDVFYRYGSLPIAIRNYYDYKSEEDALKYNAKLFDDIIASYVLKLDQTFQPSSVVTIANMLLNHCGQKVDLRQISDFSKVSFSKTFAIVLALQNAYLFKADIFNDANVLPTFSVRSDYTGQDRGDLAQGYDSCKVILNIDVYNIGFLFAKNANLESHQRLQNQWKEANKKLI